MMTYRIRATPDRKIRAAIDIEDRLVRLHSRGGPTTGRPARNPEYSEALRAILERLAPQENIIEQVVLDSRVARRSENPVILARAADFRSLPVVEVERQIKRLARNYGRADGAAPNQGNSTKQIRFDVNLSRSEIIRRLLAAEASADDNVDADTSDEVELIDGVDQTSSNTFGSGEISDIHDAESGLSSLSDGERAWAEGRQSRIEHLRRERASGLADLKRRAFTAQYGRLQCERCRIVPSETLGKHGDAVIEVHHKIPLASMPLGHETRLDDLQCLCANCHRIVHREMADSSS